MNSSHGFRVKGRARRPQQVSRHRRPRRRPLKQRRRRPRRVVAVGADEAALDEAPAELPEAVRRQALAQVRLAAPVKTKPTTAKSSSRAL